MALNTKRRSSIAAIQVSVKQPSLLKEDGVNLKNKKNMKYKLIASCDCLHKRKWATLRKLVEFGDYGKVIGYMEKRCAVKDGHTIDSDDDTDDVIFDIGTLRMTYRDMMCEECFLYAWI